MFRFAPACLWALVLVFTVYTQTVELAPTYDQCQVTRFRIVDETFDSQEWLDWTTFRRTLWDKDIIARRSVISAEVSEIPCAIKGCCNALLGLRPNTTDIHVFEQVVVKNIYAGLYNAFEAINPQYIIDAGGNIGLSTLTFALLFPEAKVIAVEPDRDNFMMLRMNTARFLNVFPANVGLWDKHTRLTVNSAEKGAWGMVFEETSSQSETSIHATTIERLLRAHRFPRVDIAKIDIEGAEGKALHPSAGLTWINTAQLIIFELHDHMAGMYGLQQVSDVVEKAMAGRSFSTFRDKEHSVYLSDAVRL